MVDTPPRLGYGLLMTRHENQTYNFHYDGPAGEPGYYHVRAVEVAPNLFNVYARNVVKDYYANGAFGTVAQAEHWVSSDRHRIATT